MRYFLILALIFLSQALLATPEVSNGPIVVSGTVPDESSHAKFIARIRELYGDANVVDELVIGKVATPANWEGYVDKLLTRDLQLISHGQLKIEGTLINVRGEVANEALRQQITSDMAIRLNPTYTIHNGLRVSAKDQNVLDTALANRNIEFQTASADLTAEGKSILDTIVSTMTKLQDKQINIIGHTDDRGLRTSNINLSLARADAVKNYLVTRNIHPERIHTSGMGPDNPIASNVTAEGRSRNRRIEFRVVQ